MNRLKLEISAGRYASLAVLPRRHLPTLSAKLNSSLTSLSIALVGDRVMSQLHEQFLNIVGPTDVLTFPLENDRRGRAMGGEIIICVPEARRRVREQRTSADQRALADEVLLYALHGLLHLSGYDDTTPKGYTAMHRMEDRLLTQLNIGPVFDRRVVAAQIPNGRRTR